jgi:hypothetical protein
MAALHILFGRRAMRRERVFRGKLNRKIFCEIGTTLKIGRKYDLRLTTFCEIDPRPLVSILRILTLLLNLEAPVPQQTK